MFAFKRPPLPKLDHRLRNIFCGLEGRQGSADRRRVNHGLAANLNTLRAELETAEKAAQAAKEKVLNEGVA